MRPRDLLRGPRGAMGGAGGPRGLRETSRGSHWAIGLVWLIHEAYMPVYKWSRFLARDGRDGTGPIKGSTRGPRGPNNDHLMFYVRASRPTFVSLWSTGNPRKQLQPIVGASVRFGWLAIVLSGISHESRDCLIDKIQPYLRFCLVPFELDSKIRPFNIHLWRFSRLYTMSSSVFTM